MGLAGSGRDWQGRARSPGVFSLKTLVFPGVLCLPLGQLKFDRQAKAKMVRDFLVPHPCLCISCQGLTPTYIPREKW